MGRRTTLRAKMLRRAYFIGRARPARSNARKISEQHRPCTIFGGEHLPPLRLVDAAVDRLSDDLGENGVPDLSFGC